MTKAELDEYIGKNVIVILFNGTKLEGILGYKVKPWIKDDYKKSGYYTIGDYGFKVSHIMQFMCDRSKEINL